MSNPNRSEKFHWSRLASEVGCIACRVEGRRNDFISIHHVNGRVKPGAHMQVLPLCFEHHQGGTQDKPSVHPWKARFEADYGSQISLMEMCDRILNNTRE